jgi:hypothetical protein
MKTFDDLDAAGEKMMRPCEDWFRGFDVPVGLIPEVEERLFAMNIH